MSNTTLDEQKNSPREGDEWGLELRTGIGKRADERKRTVELNAQESRIIVEVIKHNNELRQWWKWVGISAVTLLLIAALTIKIGLDYNWLVNSVLAVAFVVFVVAETKYINLKNRGIHRCKNCGENFVPKENDLDKKCPNCNAGNSAAYQ